MRDAFTIIAEFLDRYDGEVQGRAWEEPPPRVRQHMEAFARGDLEPASREALVQTLHEHPEWIALLAREVKSRRPTPASQE